MDTILYALLALWCKVSPPQLPPVVHVPAGYVAFDPSWVQPEQGLENTEE